MHQWSQVAGAAWKHPLQFMECMSSSSHLLTLCFFPGSSVGMTCVSEEVGVLTSCPLKEVALSPMFLSTLSVLGGHSCLLAPEQMQEGMLEQENTLQLWPPTGLEVHSEIVRSQRTSYYYALNFLTSVNTSSSHTAHESWSFSRMFTSAQRAARKSRPYRRKYCPKSHALNHHKTLTGTTRLTKKKNLRIQAP